MYYVIFMDDDYSFHVSKVFMTKAEAIHYASTIAVSREPFIVKRIEE
jgi:hypothetical protein